MSNQNQLIQVTDLKKRLANEYQKQITNYFGDEKKALKFLSGVTSAVQKNPELLECSPQSVINSFMTMAQLELMPSDVSGEAYVLPYNNKGAKQAQFQLGYQGLVTLFYRAGCKSINAEIVYEKDKFSYINGQVYHEPDVFADDRGKAIGAYVIVETQNGGKISKVMKKDEILRIGSRFSKSYKSSYSPWKEANDPELWMWRKTVLKQASKLIPKNETIYKAIAEDNKDSNLNLPTPEKFKKEDETSHNGSQEPEESQEGETVKEEKNEAENVNLDDVRNQINK